MSVGIAWEETDFAIVEAAINSVAAQTVRDAVGTGFVSPFEANELPGPETLFTPTGDPANPRLFVRWGVEYEYVETTLDGDVSDRGGRVELQVFGEYGTAQVSLGRVAKFYVDALLAAADEETMGLYAPTPPRSLPITSGFVGRSYGVEFKATG